MGVSAVGGAIVHDAIVPCSSDVYLSMVGTNARAFAGSGDVAGVSGADGGS